MSQSPAASHSAAELGANFSALSLACVKRAKAASLGLPPPGLELDGGQLPPGLGRERIGGRRRFEMLHRPGRLALGQTQFGLTAAAPAIGRAVARDGQSQQARPTPPRP